MQSAPGPLTSAKRGHDTWILNTCVPVMLLLVLLFTPGVAQPMQADASAVDSAPLNQAKTLIREGKTGQADAAVRAYLQAGHDGATARALLGLILYQEGRGADSLAEFTHAAKFRTPSASDLIVVGLDYVLLRDLGNADKWMTIATQRAPENASAWQYLGGIKYSENRFAEAIAAYDKCLSLHPHDVLVEDAIGRSLEGLGQDQDAAAAYRKALSWQADAQTKSAQPLLHLGALLARQGQLESALPLLISAAAAAPKNADIHEQLGTVYLQLRQLPKAQSEVEMALALSPGNSHLHWLLASIYRAEGRGNEADREMQRYGALLGAHSSDKLH